MPQMCIFDTIGEKERGTNYNLLSQIKDTPFILGYKMF